MALRKEKPRWKDPRSEFLYAAGGVFLYDSNGVWVVQEDASSEYTPKRHAATYTDIGGRYEVNDCNIYETIRRELYQETYGTMDVTTSMIRNIDKMIIFGRTSEGRTIFYTEVCPSGREHISGAYLSVIVNLDESNFPKPNPEEFDKQRKLTYEAVPRGYKLDKDNHKQIRIVQIPLAVLKSNASPVKISFRLQQLLNHF
jgi:hypothetical protein